VRQFFLILQRCMRAPEKAPAPAYFEQVSNPKKNRR
jgi:hypothetical protein